MSYTHEELIDIFERTREALIQNNNYTYEEFESEFDAFKHFKDKSFTDNEYYRIMVAVVFYSGFKAATVTKRMNVIYNYFPNYETVMKYDEAMIQKIITDPEMISHSGKIKACVKNAKRFNVIITKHGSFAAYIASYEPDKDDFNLFRLKSDLENFGFLGGRTSYHFMMDIGLNVLKPDRVLGRIFSRIGIVLDENDLIGIVRSGRQFSEATGFPIRYIDIVFVLYGQVGDKTSKITGICIEDNPRCAVCRIKEYCKRR